MIFDLRTLNRTQSAITQRAISLCDFPWDRLVPGLQQQTRKSKIPVEWADLSRWAASNETHASNSADELLHWHVEEGGDKAHVLGGDVNGRHAALGLAWYSGKISIDRSLVSNPDLAIEVFLSEGAHMVDFFYMTADVRSQIFDVFHGTSDDRDTPEHAHGWFEETGNQDYWSWVGESFMTGFMMAYAPSAPMALFARQPWEHRATPEIGQSIKRLLTPDLVPVIPDPVVPDPVTPDPVSPSTEFVGVSWNRLYHRKSCPTVIRSRTARVLTPEEVAVRRPCRRCRP